MNVTASPRETPLHVEFTVTGLPDGTTRLVAYNEQRQVASADVSPPDALLFDFTAPVGETVYRIAAVDAEGIELASATVAVSLPEPPSSHVWLSDPLDETSAILVPLTIDGDRERPVVRNVEASHSLAGRTILSVGASHYGPWEIVLHATDAAAIDALQEFFLRASSILIRPGTELHLPRRIYGAVPEAIESLRLQRPFAKDGFWALTVARSDGPGIDVVISSWTWDGLEAFTEEHQLTWDTLGDVFPTWLDVQRGPQDA